jgi:hypothetical protein
MCKWIQENTAVGDFKIEKRTTLPRRLAIEDKREMEQLRRKRGFKTFFK